MDSVRVIVISSVLPEATCAGEVILYRHLANRAEIRLEVYGREPNGLGSQRAPWRLIDRLGRTRFHRLAESVALACGGRWLDPVLPRGTIAEGPTVVLTVAHGDACMAALRFARRRKLPLLAFFHDWWPDIPDVYPPLRKLLHNDFLRLYRHASAALCVSDGMRAALGEHPSAASILYPIPSKPTEQAIRPTTRVQRGMPFKLLYFGNLYTYGQLLGEALTELAGCNQLRLEVRGNNPPWPEAFRNEMRQSGLWRDFAPREQLDGWLLDADAFLVPMVFGGGLRRRMQTSFPSKLTEMAQFGKPLVVWGPEYCSAIKWARQGNGALCVTNPDPAALRDALKDLANSPHQQKRLAAAARKAALAEFNPDNIQGQFTEALRAILRNG